MPEKIKYQLVSFSDLQEWTGYKSKSAIIKILNQNGIKFVYTRDGIATTIDSINAGMGVIENKQERVITF